MVENKAELSHETSTSIAFNLIIVKKQTKTDFSAIWSVFVAHDVIFSDMKCKSIGTSIVLVFGCILIDYYSRSLNVKFPLTLASLSCSSLIICFPLYALTGNLLLIIISPKNGPNPETKKYYFFNIRIREEKRFVRLGPSGNWTERWSNSDRPILAELDRTTRYRSVSVHGPWVMEPEFE